MLQVVVINDSNENNTLVSKLFKCYIFCIELWVKQMIQEYINNW